jgi:hypothetical protein
MESVLFDIGDGVVTSLRETIETLPSFSVSQTVAERQVSSLQEGIDLGRQGRDGP